MSSSIIWIGMDVHTDTVMVGVFRDDAREAEVGQQLPNDVRELHRFFQRWQACGEIRTCYEASGAGYVLHRELTDWGLHHDVVAASLTPVRPGEQRKHDRRDAIQLGRLYRAVFSEYLALLDYIISRRDIAEEPAIWPSRHQVAAARTSPTMRTRCTYCTLRS